MFNSSYAGYNHSEFREIIIILSIPTCAQMSAAMAKIYLTVYVFKVYPAFLNAYFHMVTHFLFPSIYNTPAEVAEHIHSFFCLI